MVTKGKNIVHKRLVRSYITSVISISLVLVLMAAAAVFAVNAGGLARWFKENMAVSVMLKQSTSEKEGRALAEDLAGRPYVKESRFISKEEGAEEMKSLLGEDFLSVFNSSPIPISIDLKLNGEYITKDSLEWVKAQLMENHHVEEVVYQENLVETLNTNLRSISLVLGIVILLLLVISFALINNTVRLNLYARRFTIYTMSLVGAKRSFIARPFLGRSIWYGICGSAIALIALAVATGVFNQSFEGFELLRKDHMLWYAGIAAVIIVIGMVLSYLSTLFAVNRYLRRTGN